LVLSKYGAAMSLLAVLLLGVVASGALFGGLAFGFGPLPTLSGTTLSVGGAAARILAAGAFMVLAASGLVAVGLCISTLTDSGPGATVATVILAIASEVCDNIPSLHVVHPYLPTHGWLAFTDLFRFPVSWTGMRGAIVVSGVYTALFLGLALWNFGHKDVTA
jgi:ABC-2 type transport system permease protein